MNVFALLSLGRALKRVEKMAQEIDIKAPWNHSKAKIWDGETLESWIRNNISTKRAKDYFRLVSEGVFSTESSDMSFLHFLFYLKSGGGIDSLVILTMLTMLTLGRLRHKSDF